MTLPDPTRARSRRPPVRTRAPLALAFVALSLIALVVVPIYMGRPVATAQDRITGILQPALEATARLSLVQARQMARLQSFLLTGDRAYRLRYTAAITEEDSLYHELGDLVRVMDFDVRERLAQLSAESTRWRFENLNVFDELLDPEVQVALRAQSQSVYDGLQRATRELERAVGSEVGQATRDMARWRRRQAWITVGLALLALGSTLVVGLVSRRVRGLVSEADRRRTDAVRARREIDALLEATGDGVLGIDLDGAAISLNRVGAELLGITESEMRGRDVHDALYHTDQQSEAVERDVSPILTALASGGRATSGDSDILWRRDRTSFPARWALLPLVDGTEVRGAVLTFTDMTESREKEDALRRAVEQRDEVVSIVSHDLRNPLGVVAAAAEILIDLPLDPPERRKQAEIIARSATRMGRLIEDLLDVARIEAGALVVRPSSEEPRPVLLEVQSMFEQQASQAGVSLSVGSVCDAPIRMDRDRTMQALANLVENAIRVTAEGGSVTLGAKALDENLVALSVADTGTGLAPEVVQHLFDRFWQGEGKGGSGLGLAIVRGVAEAHGGEVRVDSELGVGSTFHLVLPRA